MATSFSFAGIVGFYALYRTGLILFRKIFDADVLIIHEMIGASYLASAGMINNAKTGRTFKAGQINPKVLSESLGF